jgi:hypothetical protein
MTPVIYLHGFASSPASRKAQYFRERLAARGVELAIPDLAEGNFAGLTLSGQLGVMERVAAGRAVRLIGSSMGGYLAALYAARHPEVEGAVLLAPAFDLLTRWREWRGEAQMAEWRRTGSLAVFHYGENREASLGYQLIEDAARFEPFPDVRQPVLLIHGRRDDAVPLAVSERFARGRGNVALCVLDSDHELGDVLDQVWLRTESFFEQLRGG